MRVASARQTDQANAREVAAEWVETMSLNPWAENPRNNDDAVKPVMESIKRFGFAAPIVARAADREIIAGHTRWRAAQALGLAKVPVRFVDLDPADAHLLALADNKLNEKAEWDDAAAARILSEFSLDDAALAGWDQKELDALANSILEDGDNPVEEDEPPPVPVEAVTKVGDLYALGPHRLLCGDSTVAADVARVMDGRLADIVWTDPPYGVAYVGKTKDALTIENDALDENGLREFLSKAFTGALASCREGASWYVAAPPGPLHWTFADLLLKFGVYRAAIIWVKDAFVLGHSDYHYRHEPIFYGWKPGAAHYFVDDRTQDSVWEIPRPKRSAEHPTMKPIELVARALRNSSRKGELVYEPFGGSGTTLIAAEQTGRVAAVIEKSPNYCDVIVKRWEELTGQKATLVRDGA